MDLCTLASLSDPVHRAFHQCLPVGAEVAYEYASRLRVLSIERRIPVVKPVSTPYRETFKTYYWKLYLADKISSMCFGGNLETSANWRKN